MSPKRYDRAYFDRWYRDRRVRIWARAEVERKVRMVVSVAEYLLDRPVRSVLDVGCGEGSWQPILKRLRPASSYLGVDESGYAVQRYGTRRNIRRGSLGALVEAGIRGAFDLIVCCDVLHYVPTADVRAGLAFLRAHARGLAYLEAYTASDAIDGDRRAFQRRSAATYRRLFREAGFAPCGLHCYVPREAADALVALERAAGP